MKNFLTEITRDEVQKILKKNPVWISRISILVSLIVISIILFISFYIKYPVVSNSRLKVISVSESGTLSVSILINEENNMTLKPEQEVKIILDRYSINEYGFLKGNIKSITILLPNTQYYSVEVLIANGFKTNKEKRIEIKSEMEGNIEITTEEIPMIKKLLKSVKIIPSVILNF